MHGSHNLGVGQLPDVDVMAAKDARQILDVLSDVVDIDVVRSRLEKNLGRGLVRGMADFKMISVMRSDTMGSA